MTGILKSTARLENETRVRCPADTHGDAVTKADVVKAPEGIGLLAGDRLDAKYTFARGVTGHFASKKGALSQPTRCGLQVFGSKDIIETQSGHLAPAYILRDSSWSLGRTGKQWETITSAGIGKPGP